MDNSPNAERSVPTAECSREKYWEEKETGAKAERLGECVERLAKDVEKIATGLELMSSHAHAPSGEMHVPFSRKQEATCGGLSWFSKNPLGRVK